MQLKVFVLPVKNLGAAEAEMNAFLRGHRVPAVKKEFVVAGLQPAMAAACAGSICLPAARRRGAPKYAVRAAQAGGGGQRARTV